jgi:putative NIF3 family GTP cyclohydrolase 1 type 2
MPQAHPTRRDFLRTAASAVAAANLRITAHAAGSITAGVVIDRLRDKAGVPWRDGSVDGVKAGSADAIVTGIATTVMATAEVLRRAANAGRNLIITQEPTFYTAAEDGAGRGGDAVYLAKQALVEERHLVVWRFSDHWNLRKPSEPLTALANALGWSAYRQPDAEGLYKIPDIRLDALIEHVRTRLHVRGGLRWLGPVDLPIRTVLLSPGTTDLPSTVARLPRADAIIAGEPREWEAVPYVLDTRPRKGMIAVGRIVSLEPSASACAAWVRSVVPELPAEAIAVGDPYWSPAFAPRTAADGARS